MTTVVTTQATGGDEHGATAAISIRGVSKNFGGLAALSDVTFDIDRGSITGLIGPNGAGKSTLFNIASGTLGATSGEVRLFGELIHGGAPHKVASLGLSRTFQATRIFSDLSVLENLVVAHLSREPLRNLWRPRLGWRIGARAAALRIADDFGLGAVADSLARNLSNANMRVLMLAGAVIRQPQVIFLDEIVAGMDAKACHQISLQLRELSKTGVTVLLVEHNLSFVFETAAYVFALDAGVLIARGTPEEIQQDAEVGRVYFGSQPG